MRILRKSLMALTILLLAAAVVMAVMLLTGCSKEPESYPEAEEYVKEQLEAIKNADADDGIIKSLTEDVSGDFDGAMLEGYIDKLKEFDYEIIDSSKAKSEEGTAAAVTVRITTYDFGNEFLKAWNEHMSQDEEDRWQSQFYSFLLIRLSSVSSKDFTSRINVICTDANDDGNWKTDIKGNEDLMNAISGGMMNEIKNLITDDVIMDEDELG